MLVRFFALVLWLISASYAQVDEAPDPKVEAFARKATQYYESLVQSILTKYYDEERFLVDAQVSVEAASPLESGKKESPVVEALPGLPMLPENGEDGASQNAATVRSVNLEILIDTSYGEKAKAFIKNLITMGADLNEMRGDRIRIALAIFPAKSLGNTPRPLPIDEQPKTENKSTYTSDKNSEPTQSHKPVTEWIPPNPFQPFIDNLASLIPLIVVCVFLLLITWLIMRTISARKGKEEERFATIMQEIQQIRATTSIPALLPPPPKNNEPDAAEEELRSFLITVFIGSPNRCAQVLRTWLAGEKGTAEAAAIIKLVDTKLLNSLESEFSSSIYQSIKTAMHNPPPDDLKPPKELAMRFKADYERLGQSDLSHEEMKDLFGFLRQLNDQQILHLLKDEPEGMVGLVLAQLDAEAASRLLQKIDPSTRAKVLGSMGKVENISIKIYKELADRLSRKALDVIHMRFVASDGVDSVQRILDRLPVSLQEEYLNNLAEVNLTLAEKVRKTFITLSEIPTLPDTFLGGFVRKVDQEILILCLIKADAPVREKILHALPERMRAMIGAGMESRSDAKEDEIERAQQRFLSHLRDEIRLSGGRPA